MRLVQIGDGRAVLPRRLGLPLPELRQQGARGQQARVPPRSRRRLRSLRAVAGARDLQGGRRLPLPLLRPRHPLRQPSRPEARPRPRRPLLRFPSPKPPRPSCRRPSLRQERGRLRPQVGGRRQQGGGGRGRLLAAAQPLQGRRDPRRELGPPVPVRRRRRRGPVPGRRLRVGRPQVRAQRGPEQLRHRGRRRPGPERRRRSRAVRRRGRVRPGVDWWIQGVRIRLWRSLLEPECIVVLSRRRSCAGREHGHRHVKPGRHESGRGGARAREPGAAAVVRRQGGEGPEVQGEEEEPQVREDHPVRVAEGVRGDAASDQGEVREAHRHRGGGGARVRVRGRALLLIPYQMLEGILLEKFLLLLLLSS